MKPLFRKQFWFYNDWLGKWPSVGSDEYGWLTWVLPLGKGRAVVFSILPHYLFCKFCYDCRMQTLGIEQDNCYTQTYWNIEDYDDVYDLSNEEIDESLGVTRF